MTPTNPGKLLVSEYLTEVFFPARRAIKSAQTKGNYQTAVGYFIDFAGDVPMGQLSADLLDSFEEWLAKECELADETCEDHAKRVRSLWRLYNGESLAYRDAHGKLIPCSELQKRIAETARQYANGKPLTEIANEFGITDRAVLHWQVLYPEIWQAAFEAAMQGAILRVRNMAGTDAVLQDAAAYIKQADHAEKWCRDKGVPLFDHGDKITLSKFFDTYYLPVCLGDAQPATVEVYRIILRRWQLLTGDPPLVEITNLCVARFRDALLQLPGMTEEGFSPNTGRSYMTHIQAILDRASKPNRWNREGAGIIDLPPYARKPRKVERVPVFVPDEHLAAVYQAADEMTKPEFRGCSPGDWWRGLLVTAFNTGLRKGTLFKLKAKFVDWRECTIKVPHQLLRKSRREQVIPLNAAVMEHLERIRGISDYLFPLPFSERWFDVQFYRLQKLAGVPSYKQFGLQNMRVTHATKLWVTAPEAAQYQLGHSSLLTTIKHYIAGQSIVAAGVAKLPQPWASKVS